MLYYLSIYPFAYLGRDAFQGLPGMLGNSLPHTYGCALFDQWLALTGHNSDNSIELLCPLGKRCMGALEFEHAFENDRYHQSDR